MPKNVKFCQQCRFFTNNPGKCSKLGSFIARKNLACKDAKQKKGVK